MAYNKCTAESDNRYGFNSTVYHCATCTITRSASINALCGSGLVWQGDDAKIENNFFANNGDGNDPMAWADGLSISKSARISVRSNRFVDNSDVALISFGATNSSITGNQIVQDSKYAFAGLMLDGGEGGNFVDTYISYNTVTCSPGKCFFAINIGSRAWSTVSPAIWGGSVLGNTITGGVVGLNVNGTVAGSQQMYVGGTMFNTIYTGDYTPCLGMGGVNSAPFLKNDPFSVMTVGGNMGPGNAPPQNQNTDYCI